MTLFRTMTFVTLTSLTLVSCGKKAEPAPAEKPANPVAKVAPTSSEADKLFDEFFDSSNVDDAALSEGSAAAKEALATDSATTNPKATGDKLVQASAKKSVSKVKFNQDGNYVLQVSCVASEELAEKVAKKLEKTGFPVYVAEVQNPTPQLIGTYYRIRIGGFSDRDAAKTFGEAQLTPIGFSYWVDTRSNDNQGTSASESAPKTAAQEPVAATGSGSKEEAW